MPAVAPPMCGGRPTRSAFSTSRTPLQPSASSSARRFIIRCGTEPARRTTPAVIAPALGHAPDSLAEALSRYCAAGGRLWVVGEAPLCGRDEYNRPREFSLPEDAVRRFPGGVSARELWPLFLAEMQATGIRRFATLTDAEGQAPWGVEYRTVRERDGVLLSVANLWGTPRTVHISVGGRMANAIHDLRTDQQVSGNEITLQPLEATVLKVR